MGADVIPTLLKLKSLLRGRENGEATNCLKPWKNAVLSSIQRAGHVSLGELTPPKTSLRNSVWGLSWLLMDSGNRLFPKKRKQTSPHVQTFSDSTNGPSVSLWVHWSFTAQRTQPFWSTIGHASHLNRQMLFVCENHRLDKICCDYFSDFSPNSFTSYSRIRYFWQVSILMLKIGCH